MFNELVECTVNRRATYKTWTFAVASVFQAAILFVFVLIPLLFTEALPKSTLQMFLVGPPRPAAPRPPSTPVSPNRDVSRILHNGLMTTPTAIPRTVSAIREEDLPPDVTPGAKDGVPGGVDNGQPNGVPSGILNGTGTGNPPPPSPTASVQHRIRVGGNVQAAKMIRQVQPVYSQIARVAHAQGTVVLHAVIAKDGSVQELSFVSGPPLLMPSAMEAVRQWRYQPTLLNGEPVEVDTTISVIFTIGGQN
jgi:protein TonB